MTVATLPDALRADVETLWNFNQMHHALRPVDVGVGLGSHDLGVADHAAHLYRQGLFPLIVFTGANAPTTVERFPRGEAVHYSERAVMLGVPEDVVIVEPSATNTGENIDFTRALLEARSEPARSVMLISRPYQQRRAYGMCRLRWPGIDVVCSSEALPLDDYVARIGDVDGVVTMLVGDTQRVWVHARKGWAVEQEVPGGVRDAYDRLVAAGYTERVLPDD